MGSWPANRLTDIPLLIMQVGCVLLYFVIARIILMAAWRDWRDKRRVYWQGLTAIGAETVVLVWLLW